MYLSSLALYPIWIVTAVMVRSSPLRDALLDGQAIGYTLGSLLTVFVFGRIATARRRDSDDA
jgi:hypothetical protein